MLTKEQVLTIHTRAQSLLSVCPTELLEHVLIILEQTEGAVKALDGFQWTEEADQSVTLAYQGQKMGRVTQDGSSYRGVILHEYDRKTDSDETPVYLGPFHRDAMIAIENNVKNIIAARAAGQAVAHV